jgi:hypothetical protein
MVILKFTSFLEGHKSDKKVTYSITQMFTSCVVSYNNQKTNKLLYEINFKCFFFLICLRKDSTNVAKI